MTVEVADVLDKAADLIDPAKGGRWIRGAARDDAGGYCMSGALQDAAEMNPLRHRWAAAQRAFTDATNTVQRLLGEDMVAWNDQDCLDGHEAANVLRKAAEIERAGVVESGSVDGRRRGLEPARPPADELKNRTGPTVNHPGT